MGVDLTPKPPKQIDGVPQTVSTPRIGREVIYATHNFCDETTWYTDSARVTDEALTEGDGLTYDLAQVCVINLREGKVFDEEGIYADQAIQEPDDPHAYEVVVEVDGVPAIPCDPFEDGTNDFHVDYGLGKIVFHASQAGKAVTASYSYKDGAGWEMRPTPGMSLAIEEAEVQFSVDVNFNTTLVMEVFGAVDFFAPHLMSEPYNFPSGTPIPISNTLYKTVYQLIDEAIGAKPPIPIFPNSDAKRAPQQEIHVFTFRYTVTKPMFSSLGMFTRISMASGVAMPGERTTATFYLTAHMDDDPMVAMAKLTGA